MNTLDDILNFLEENKDDEYARFVCKLLPKNLQSNIGLFGVRLPLLRQFAKKLCSTNDWQILLTPHNLNYFELTMLEGFVIAYAPIELNIRQKYIMKFLPKITNWSVCDSFCASFHLKENEKLLYLSFIKKQLNSTHEYHLRFAVVMLLDYYLTIDYADDALKLIYEVPDDFYSVKMAKAWAFSKYFTYYPENGLKFLKNKSLNKDVYTMTCQKIRDSRRISPEYKNALKNL